MTMSLPPAVASVDVAEWDRLRPFELQQRIIRETSNPGFAAKALRYAHGDDTREYDEIGERLAAVTAFCGSQWSVVPL
jgi:hypothetical protein